MVKRKRAATLKETEAKTYGYNHAAADIPHEVLLQILQKLPVKSLKRFTCVSKLWFESIENDPRFIKAHFLESQKNPILIFDFLSKRYDKNPTAYQTNHLYYLQKDESFVGKKKVLPQLEQLKVRKNYYQMGLIGNCNGLLCFSVASNPYPRIPSLSYFIIEIFNFSKLEKLRIVSRIHRPRQLWMYGCRFGYDCLSNRYKLMYHLSNHANSHSYFILTLGSSDTQLWREIKNPATEGYIILYINCTNGALYWWLCDTFLYKRALLSLDLHEEKFQVIELPNEFKPYIDPKKRLLTLEFGKCLCVANIKESDACSGVVELYILKDRIKQVWVKETSTFDLPVSVCPSTNTNKNNTDTTFSGSGDSVSIDSIRIIEFAGKFFLYWGESLLHKGRRSRMIQFYDLQSRELNQVRVGCKCGPNYRITNHVENLISLRAWATKDGDGGGELGRNIDKSAMRTIQDMFKQIPPSANAAVSFFSSLS